MFKDVRLIEAVAIYLAAVVFTVLSLITTGHYKSALKCATVSCVILLLLLATVEIGRRISPSAIPMPLSSQPATANENKKSPPARKHRRMTHRQRAVMSPFMSD